MIQKFSSNVFFFLFLFFFLYLWMQSPKRNPYELEYRILVFRPEYPGDWYQNLLFSSLSDSREIIPAPFITRLTSNEVFFDKFPQPKKVTWNELQSCCICSWHQRLQLPIWHPDLFETVRIWERLNERARIQSLLQFFTTFSKWRNTISPLEWAAFWTGI